MRLTWIVSFFDIFEIRFVEQVTEVCFVGQWDAKDLSRFVDTSLQSHIVPDYCNKAISDYGTIDLDARRILRCAPKLLDFWGAA